jgi:hypothetical protein
MKSIFIYCDGGFGNRYNALLSGLAIAEAGGLEPVIVWPTNNWCGASYEDIFENARVVQNRELVSFVAEKDRYHHLMVEDHLSMNVPNVSPSNFTDFPSLLEYAKATDKDVFYYVALIPQCVDMLLVKKHLLANPFCPAIRDRAAAFLREQNLSEFFGIQIRKTDFGAGGADDQNLFDLISKCPDKVFFVCSDDKDVERRFAALENVRIYDKQAHVEKLVEGTWNSHTADHSGRVYACNVNRGALSVMEAIVDLLILSKSKVVKTSNSTFLNAALLLQSCGAE